MITLSLAHTDLLTVTSATHIDPTLLLFLEDREIVYSYKIRLTDCKKSTHNKNERTSKYNQ